jgi:hypothetical protein
MFAAMGIFRDAISNEFSAMNGWATGNPRNHVAMSMHVPPTDALEAWFMPSCLGEFE